MASFHVMAGPGEMLAHPAIRRIGLSDVWDALARGFDDFRAKPSHYVFLSLIYPICGIVLVTWSSGANMLPLIFPLVAGFALLGPFFAIGLYEISRRRELGMDTSWRHALEVRHSPALPSILAVGAMLMVLFVAWLVFAQMLYTNLFGAEPPQSLALFLASVFSSENGLLLMLAGNTIGFCFALVVLATTVIDGNLDGLLDTVNQLSITLDAIETASPSSERATSSGSASSCSPVVSRVMLAR